MYKRYFHQKLIDCKSLFQGPKEEEFQKSFLYIFSTKESLDDIESENELYFYNSKQNDITKSTTNAKEIKDYDIHRINSLINRKELLPLKKENQISYKRETDKSYINKSHEQSPLTRAKEETTPKTDEKKVIQLFQQKIKLKYG